MNATPGARTADAAQVELSLVSHTNAGKTTLARTLLGRDIGEIRDAAHVTEIAEGHVLIDSPAGDRLSLWDTPGFGDSHRLARRLEQSGSPIGLAGHLRARHPYPGVRPKLFGKWKLGFPAVWRSHYP